MAKHSFSGLWVLEIVFQIDGTRKVYGTRKVVYLVNKPLRAAGMSADNVRG